MKLLPINWFARIFVRFILFLKKLGLPTIERWRSYFLAIVCSTAPFTALAGPADIKPSPILNLQAGISDELIVAIRKGETKINDLIIVFTEDDQKNLPVRIDQKFSPLCAAAAGRNMSGIKQLVELGADVNSMCVNNWYINTPLELAYRNPALMEKDNEATAFLKRNGAKVSDGWIEINTMRKNLARRMEEEAKKNATENLMALGKLAAVMAKAAIGGNLSGMPMNPTRLANTLIGAAQSIGEERQQASIAELQEKKEENPILSEFKFAPYTHSHREYFSELEAGKAWCSGTKQVERLIDILRSTNAALGKMRPCGCVAASAQEKSRSYVCGIPYSITQL